VISAAARPHILAVTARTRDWAGSALGVPVRAVLAGVEAVEVAYRVDDSESATGRMIARTAELAAVVECDEPLGRVIRAATLATEDAAVRDWLAKLSPAA
jgi:hypothetical protein